MGVALRAVLYLLVQQGCREKSRIHCAAAKEAAAGLLVRCHLAKYASLGYCRAPITLPLHCAMTACMHACISADVQRMCT